MPSDLAAAATLLTRLPVRVAGTVHGVGAAWFPVVGALLGAASAIAVAVLAPVDPTLAAIAGLAVLATLTGALHLDGLADTADALLAPDAGRAEQARRDPRVGAGGAVALVLVLGAEVAGLAAAVRALDIVVVAASTMAAAAAARLVPVLVALLPAAPDRSDAVAGRAAGFGAWFAARVRPLDAVAGAVVLALVVAGATWATGTIIPAVVAIATVGLGLLLAAALLRRRGGLDGDLLGAATELATLAATTALAILAAVA